MFFSLRADLYLPSSRLPPLLHSVLRPSSLQLILCETHYKLSTAADADVAIKSHPIYQHRRGSTGPDRTADGRSSDGSGGNDRYRGGSNGAHLLNRGDRCRAGNEKRSNRDGGGDTN